MSERNTLIRSMHDLGVAAWFGGSLMGVFGVNGGAAAAKDPAERLRLSSIGWAKWAPVQLTAIAVHGIGGLALIYTNRGRLGVQPDSRTNTVVKTLVTGAAGAVSVMAAIAGSRIGKYSAEGGEGVTEVGAGATSPELAKAQRAEKWLQYSIPLLTGTLIVLGAQQGEQQRPGAGVAQTWVGRAKGLFS